LYKLNKRSRMAALPAGNEPVKVELHATTVPAWNRNLRVYINPDLTADLVIRSIDLVNYLGFDSSRLHTIEGEELGLVKPVGLHHPFTTELTDRFLRILRADSILWFEVPPLSIDRAEHAAGYHLRVRLNALLYLQVITGFFIVLAPLSRSPSGG
jgi:hypothetical protein